MTESRKQWSIDDVDARLRQAVLTAHRLPPVRVAGYFSLWPAILRTEYERMAADVPRKLRFPPTPVDIEQMLETMRWVQWIEIEQRKLVWMRAERYRWDDIARRFGCAARTAQRRCDAALHMITLHLNKGS